MGVLSRTLALAVGLAATSCDDARFERPAWAPADAIEGRLRPEINQPAPAARPGRLRVVTYNVRLGLEVEVVAPYFLSDPALSTADLVMLQEIDDDPAEGASDASQLAAALGLGFVYAPTYEVDGGTRGVAILSRFVLQDIEVMYLQEAPDLLVPAAARAAVAAVIETERGPVRVVNVHLDYPLNITERILQLRPAIIDAPTPVVVAGDFNTNDYVWADGVIPLLPLDAVADTSQAKALDRYMRGLGFDTPTAELGATWNGLLENQRLDAVFTRGVPSGDGAVDRGLDDSDHWPLWLDLDVRR